MYLIRFEETAFPSSFISNPEAQIKAVKELKYRDGDVMICAYPKCGNNWVETLIRCLFRKDKSEDILAKPSIIDYLSPEAITSMSSPRVFFSHLWPKRMPKEHVAKRGKMVFLVRNPKDVVVSAFYHFTRSPLNYVTTWDEHFEAFIKGEVFAGDMFAYLEAWEQALKADMFNIKYFYYEDLKRKPVETLNEIAQHIGLTKTTEELEAIAEECSIRSIKKWMDPNKIPPPVKDGNEHILFRKGETGDWKNHFTVNQSESFDKLIEEKLKNSMFTFTYE